ncbi:Non-heme 11 kDa protein of cytochrome bc1 complex [Mycena metata]|uniref:Non-heme 11 kDa protein of cytochrome bc1 complex n=1 Tax=Mycena metata TaxID=1033252 RepID=A0AAD7MNX7_9AGAR|nr:Non-heme 11 kDa protein of cytochrome bc1 complex [Mycena metata]
MSGLGSFLSSFFPSTHADSDSDDSKSDDSSKKESAPEAGAAEEEEEEPEDAAPGIRDACAARAECAPMKHHFEKCQEKIEAGKGFKGEECVEEFLMHCSEACAAPQIFAKLR